MSRSGFNWDRVHREEKGSGSGVPFFRRLSLPQRAFIRKLEKKTNTAETGLEGMSMNEGAELIEYLLTLPGARDWE